MPRLAFRTLRTVPSIAGLPRLAAVGYERQTGPGYHRAIGERLGNYVGVQIGISGEGALWERPGPWRGEPGWRVIPPHHALLFIVGEEQLAYGGIPRSDSPWEFVFANLEGEAALAMARGLIAERGRILPLGARHGVARELQRLARGRGALRAEVGIRLAADLFSALVAGAPDADGALVQRAMDLLAIERGTPLSLVAIARQLGVSREHLSRCFTRVTGRPPARWLVELRLARSSHLLEDPTLSLAAIARTTGFGSATLLIRHFSARHGLTPGAYRRQLLGSDTAP